MDRARQVALLRRVFAHLDARSTDLADAPYPNPATAYTSPDRFARERDRILQREPVLVGLSGDLSRPGDYLVHEHAGVPILTLRTSGGEVRAFVATCRHRGAPVAAGRGSCNGRFVCPYHGWTYGEDGGLLAQPHSEGFAGLSPDDLCLRALPSAECHGLILVRPCPGPPIDVDAHLGGAVLELAPFGLERYAPFASHVTRRRMNWKLVVETFLEAYHLPSLHRETIGPAILGSPALWDDFERGGRLLAVRRSVADVATRPEPEREILPHAVILYLVFPSAIVIHQIDHIEVVQVDAHGPDESTVRFSLYTPEPATTERARRHFQANFDLLIRVSEDEDFHIGEAIQRAMHAPGADCVVYGRNEPGVAHFHRAIDAIVGRAA